MAPHHVPGRPARLRSGELIVSALDPGSFFSWDEPGTAGRTWPPDYAGQLARARRSAGTDEAVVTGSGTIHGRPVAVIVSEFAFMGGSIGLDAADRLVGAVSRATAEGLPLLAATASGGTRMQEGTAAFVQMVRIAAAISTHKRAGLPYLVYLRHPTTGGVLASWGLLGHVTVAEPGALIGFLGPKVYQALHGAEFPAGVQTAENLARHGIIDAVVAPRHLAALASRALGLLTDRDLSASAGARSPAGAAAPGTELSSDAAPPRDAAAAWSAVLATRRPARPGVRQLLRHAAGGQVILLSGTGEGEAGDGMLLGLARFAGLSCVVLGHDRSSPASEHHLGPAALRVARRGMRLAAELNLPLVSVIDTPGATLSQAGEEGGLSGEIARCLEDLVRIDTATVCVLLGQGGGGGALALLPADRVLAAANAWLSPLPPEGASAILYGDTSLAPEMAHRQGIGAADLARRGIVDVIVAERPDAADEPAAFVRRMGEAIGAAIRAASALPPPARAAARIGRYANLAPAAS
ncbi:MAG TPA: carboxyl transferase domain-containing protein [Trebonia sp.]|nr:carboxyl transferase domain-containing protein [Trebonia sp.]